MDLFGEDAEPMVACMSQEYRHEYSGGWRQKVFNDCVHGHFKLHRGSVAIIDTVPYQRLRNLKQLGLAYQIYPSSSHNRFEHSLGVAHLATEWGEHLICSRDGVGEEDGWQLRRFEPEDRQHLMVLQLAGLTHDLGHGPFSHVFEKELLPRLGLDQSVVKEWSHENMSNRILDHILEDPENGIDLQELAHLGDEHVQLIKLLMHGSPAPTQDYPTAPWLFDVVANKRNGIDADKFDYLKRDSMMCGVGVPLDPKRLMLFSRLDPKKEQVVFKCTEYSNLAVGLFQTRAEMHRRVYTHPKIKSVEFMVCDALALAAGPLGLRDAVAPDAELQLYINLDDSVLQQLQKLRPKDWEHPEQVRKAQDLLRQLARRELYKFVAEVTLTAEAQQRCQDKPTAEEIVGYQSTADTGVRLNAADVIVCETRIDQGMKGRNPMDRVSFYQTADPEAGDEIFRMEQQQASVMLGTQYQDKIIRVYSKDRDRQVCKALKTAFLSWCNRRLQVQPPGTPWRLPSHQQFQQPHPRAPSVERVGWTSNAAGLATELFHGNGNGNSAEAAAAAAGTADGSFTPNGNSSQQQQHMGSGGRSRKRSLKGDMAAAAAAADGCSSQGSLGGSQGLAADGGSGLGRPVKISRTNGSSLPGIAEEADADAAC